MGSFVFSDYELSVAVLGRRKRTRGLRTPPRGTGRTSLSTEALASTRGGGSMVISRAETPGPSHQHMAAAPTTDRSSAPFLFAGCAYGSCSTNKTVPNVAWNTDPQLLDLHLFQSSVTRLSDSYLLGSALERTTKVRVDGEKHFVKKKTAEQSLSFFYFYHSFLFHSLPFLFLLRGWLHCSIRSRSVW
jgi:hypothetical protein